MPINKAFDKSGKPVKKDGLLKYRVRVNYTDVNGKNCQVERTAYGLDAARQMEVELKQSLKVEPLGSRLTVSQLFDEYIHAQQKAVKQSTLDSANYIMSEYILPTLGSVKLSKLTAPVLQRWKNDIDSTDLAFGTKKLIYRRFCAMLNFAVKMDYLQANPLAKLGGFKAPIEITTANDEMDFYTVEEFQKYIAAAYAYAKGKDTALTWSGYVFFCIAFYTGARKGEIRALRWCDIKDGTIFISKSINNDNIVTAPKTKSSIRAVGIPAPLAEVLAIHKKRCSTTDGFTDECYICGGLKAVSCSYLRKKNLDFATSAGLRVIRIHDFRHSHASLLINSGISIQEVSRRLGHADTTVTMRVYAHMYPSEKERALAVLDTVKICRESG